MRRLLVVLLSLTLVGCATGSSDIKIGEMLHGEIVSLSDGNILPMQIEIIRVYDVNGKMSAYNSETGEDFQGKYSAIFERKVVDDFVSSIATRDSVRRSTTTHSSRDRQAVTTSNTADATAVLIGDKGTILNISMKMQTGKRKTQLHGYGKAEDNKGNKYQVRF